VIVLDENFPESQRQLLRGWRIPIRQIGYEVGRKGMKDDEVIPFLHTLSRPTFFTLDLGFYRRNLCHAGYCLACMNVWQYEAAVFVRRLLCHVYFKTKAKRMGTTIRAHHDGISIWHLHAEKETHLDWETGKELKP